MLSEAGYVVTKRKRNFAEITKLNFYYRRKFHGTNLSFISDQKFDEHLALMSQNGSLGDDLEIQVISEIYECPMGSSLTLISP